MVSIMVTHLSGTAPPCFYEDLPRVHTVYLAHQRLSGTIPDISNSVDVRVLRAEGNNFVSLPQLSFLRRSLRFHGADCWSSLLFVR